MAHTGYCPIQLGLTYRYQEPWPPKGEFCCHVAPFLLNCNSTFLCAQAMRHARGLHKPQATSEHDLHTNRFVSACSVHWYLWVPSTMKIATSRGLIRWLAGLVASGHSEFACRWHVNSTADTWYKHSASSVLVGARTHIELTWPNGPMVAVGHVHHTNKSIHCLNHSGGDSHPERVARCGSVAIDKIRVRRMTYTFEGSYNRFLLEGTMFISAY